MEIKLDDIDVFSLFMAAMRYSLGRRTYMPYLITNIIVRNKDLFTDKQRKQMADEVYDYEKTASLGDECDVKTWHDFAERIAE